MRSIRNLSLTALVIAMLAIPAVSQNLTGVNWRIFNINTSEPKLWAINQTRGAKGTFAGFDFMNLSTGWYTAYMETNFGNLSNKATITVSANWTGGTLYTNRASTPGDAKFRVYFQSAEGNAKSSDYWWSTDSCNLNTVNGCTFTVDLTDRSKWSNFCGEFATDTNSYAGPNCIGGTDPATSPYDGFTHALRNVKAGGVSFGGGPYYANGVAKSDSSPASSFSLTFYQIN